MKSWYRTIREDKLKDGSIRKVYHLVFETDDKSIVEKIEQFFYDVMDAKTEPNSSEFPNNCKPQTDEFELFDREALILLIECQKERIAELLTKDEPQTDCAWR